MYLLLQRSMQALRQLKRAHRKLAGRKELVYMQLRLNLVLDTRLSPFRV
jgi:hypothetical protein